MNLHIKTGGLYIGVENGEKPVINGSINENEKVVIIEADNCTFKNFIVMYGRGMIVKNSNNCKIENNDVIKAKPLINSTRYAALEIHKSHNCEIINNSIEKSKGEGMAIWKSSVKIFYNRISNSYNDKGMYIIDSYNCIVSYNDITENQDGINIDRSENSVISFNNIYYNSQYGIVVFDSQNLSISNNIIYHHSYEGIALSESSYCNVSENNIYENGWGVSVVSTIRIPWSNVIGNVVTKNSIHHNGVGIYLYTTRKNSFIMNNLIDNGKNAWFIQSLWLGDPNPLFPLHNTWLNNYWSDWHLSLPKPITGYLWLAVYPYLFTIPWLMFDWQPALQPWEIG